MENITKNHSKYLLMYHFIFVVKYRKQIIDRFPIKELFETIQINQNFEILKMETDTDHIHLLIRSEPKIAPVQVVKRLKQISNNYL